MSALYWYMIGRQAAQPVAEPYFSNLSEFDRLCAFWMLGVAFPVLVLSLVVGMFVGEWREARKP